ncbi:uncharacterized protein EDB93DRAFT_1244804 [Suillus bovinus]|uniref:uncharacterized protein n=1 Tax=Suillus bovinus TaxID=48563 RepID=UPI001B8785D9|nr:uncharacterized protein EDB93DRAFT_1244804 [Suillus bovinus]KAG2160050.1 hypothetical protein EDB93DRAFT_1244804 [Suillus bovinus]
MQSRLLSVASSPSPLENTVQLGSAVVIILEHSFYINDKRRYLQDQPSSDSSFHVALEQYMASPHAATVREDVSAAVQVYENRMRTAGILSAWMAKLPLERFQKNTKQARAGLTKTILDITLNHRLPRP